MSVTTWYITQEQLLVFARYNIPFYLFLMPFCIFLNTIIIVVTIRSKRLRSNCNVLIAFQAVVDNFLVLATIYPAHNAFLGRFVSISDCVFHQFPFVGVGYSTSTVVLLIGVDRYLCVAHPVWYKSLKRARYLSAYFLLSLCSSILFLSAQYINRTFEPNVLCLPSETMTEGVKWGVFTHQLLISMLIVFVYSRLRRCLKELPVQRDTETRKIMKSLTVVVVVHLLGWACTHSIWCSSVILISDINLLQALELASTPFAGINLAIPCIVYYKLSAVYRYEIRTLFRLKTPVDSVQLRNRLS
ncbi:hypothetical protein QR680_014749 [Steinernema hermaphroditum]|uniref:G-protein coupled receptors family 1 profile domain-containing protein n=1 Tax=Steinernema hermaphroditum TaxID=289476 RepID=A0AA39M4T3_9BILA|nr:hypothetical protein QR680_014749 [Steinernema hermaphroditum]